MSKQPFAQALVRKSDRALKVARLALNAGDNDSAVSRAYYAMFDIARAALLRAGVSEDKLPRTHSGLIEAFRSHAQPSRAFFANHFNWRVVARVIEVQQCNQYIVSNIECRPHESDANASRINSLLDYAP